MKLSKINIFNFDFLIFKIYFYWTGADILFYDPN